MKTFGNDTEHIFNKSRAIWVQIKHVHDILPIHTVSMLERIGWKLFDKVSGHCFFIFTTNYSGDSVVRAFAPWAGGRGFDPRPRHTKDVIKMEPAASLLYAKRTRTGLASLLSQTSFNKRDGYHPKWAVESDKYKLG